MTNLPVIGIDIGTTCSTMACMYNGYLEVIPNSLGKSTTPSIVSYPKGSNNPLVGIFAEKQLISNAENTIYNSKRLIGKLFGDPIIQPDIQKFPFNVIQHPDTRNSGPAVFEVTSNHKFEHDNELGKNWVSPQEVAAEILKNMKTAAEEYLGAPVKQAVITVPACFKNEQRMATKEAGKLAGLEVLRLLNETTAAAIAYGEYENINSNTENPTSQSKTILMVDLGGGTYDISLLKLKDHEYHVKCVDGDSHLGGEDFTTCLVDYYLKEFAEQTGQDFNLLCQNHILLHQLRYECNKAKQRLSYYDMAEIKLESHFEEWNYCKKILREEFEEICKGLFDRLIAPIEKVLERTNTSKSEIEEIVLIGSSVKIPKVEKLIDSYFANQQVVRTVKTNESVALGAALMAAQLARNNTKDSCSETITFKQKSFEVDS